MKTFKQLNKEQKTSIKRETRNWVNTNPEYIDSLSDLFGLYHKVIYIYARPTYYDYFSLVSQYWYCAFDNLNDIPCEINEDGDVKIDLINASHKLVEELKTKISDKFRSIEDKQSSLQAQIDTINSWRNSGRD